MEIRRWGRNSEMKMHGITDKELDYVFVELETQSISADVYRYYVEGLIVVYYTFDIQLLRKDIFEPVYLSKKDIYFLGESEDKLYQRILENTVGIFRTKLMPFHIYLNGLKTEEEEIFRPIISRLVEVMEKIKYEKMLWCVTNDFGERGLRVGFISHYCNYFVRPTGVGSYY